jgi:hypothetical protein
LVEAKDAISVEKWVSISMPELVQVGLLHVEENINAKL